MRRYITDKPFRSLNQLAAQSELWLFNTDVVIDYPRPTMPNEINIGGLSTRPADPLPDDLQKVMDAATQGVIIMSFGSFEVLSIALFRKFIRAFEEIPQTVIIRSELFDDQLKVPDHVIIRKWIPQNDLLGHANMRLFITHCGSNGQFEALYHGVPMLGMPMYGDQPYNARRAVHHGFGLSLNPLDFTSETLLKAVQSILNNQSYYGNIKRASTTFRSQAMTPTERATFWVEQVLDTGVDHLKSHAVEMAGYEYLMLDMIAIVFSIFCIISVICCGVVCHCIHRSKTTGNQKSKRE
jgi:UDP:flavonoid glycosyltransferase YjiC (YdhE family)